MASQTARRHVAIQQELKAPLENSAAGKLTLNDEPAFRSAQACKRMRQELQEVASKIEQLRALEPIKGGFTSCDDLANNHLLPKTGTSGGGEPTSFGEALKKHLETLDQMIKLYIYVGRAYQDTEGGNKDLYNFDTIRANN